jgi:hypothetical protein
MDAPLNRLVGMRLVGSDTDRGSLGLQFSACNFRAFNPFCCTAAVVDLHGSVVSRVTFTPGAKLTIELSGGAQVVVSLADADYEGPEAFVANFEGGPIVAQ